MHTYTQTVTTYDYDELSPEAQTKAIEWWLGSGLDYEWWDAVYEDAKNIGLEISEFDIGRTNHIRGSLTGDLADTLAAILKDHGRQTDTYRLVQDFYWQRHNGNSYTVEEFEHALLEEYLVMLRNEYEYLTSEESVAENIRANGYEFLEDGSIQ